MGKRGITVWIFSSLSFLAAIHALEASLALLFNTETILLKSSFLIHRLFTKQFGLKWHTDSESKIHSKGCID